MPTPAEFVAALREGDPIRALSIVRSFLADRTPLGEQWRPIAKFCADAGEWQLALAAADQWVSLRPSEAARRLYRAELLARAGRIEAAAESLAPLLADSPEPALLHFLGTLAMQMGEAARATELLRAAADRFPGSGTTWLTLANVGRMRADDPYADALLAAERHLAGAPPGERAAYLYARGKTLDDLGDHDRAFGAYREGAALARAERRYDRAADLAAARAIIANFDQRWIRDAVRHGAPTSRAIFVTGLPRSGTTLVEQILNSHSQVAGGDEVNLITTAMLPFGGVAAERLSARLRSHGRDAWSGFVERYHHLIAERFGAAGRIVDKSLNVSRTAMLIRVAFPDAPLIWMQRDRLDTAWSSFRTHFAQGVGWSFDIEDMAAHYAIEDMLFAHIRALYGDRMMAADYETLVADGDAAIPAIIDHCGLAPEPGVRTFHESKRAVTTSSVMQVRRPLNRDAIGASARYPQFANAFAAAYARERAALGLV